MSGTFIVRAATDADVPAVAAAVGDLLRELGASAPPAAEMEAVARTLIEEPAAGALFVAEDSGETADAGAAADPVAGEAVAVPLGGEAARAIVGVLGASFQSALHVPGRYVLIQDLWVSPGRRSESIGGALLAALVEDAAAKGIARAEVGLPREHFAGLAATEAFYRRNGFTPLGLRMRRVLP